MIKQLINSVNNSSLIEEDLVLLAKAIEAVDTVSLKNHLTKFPNPQAIKLKPYLNPQYVNHVSHPGDYITGCDNLLLWAVKTGSRDMVHVVLDAGISRDIEGYSAFHYLAKVGNLELLDYLLNYTLTPYQCWKLFGKNKNGWIARGLASFYLYQNTHKPIEMSKINCLTSAIEGNHLDVVKYIHKHYGFEDKAHIFYTAAVSGSKSVLEYLLENDVKPDYVFGELALIELISQEETLLQVLRYLEYKELPIDFLKSIIDGGHLVVLEKLIQNNYQVDREHYLFMGGSTITHAASKKQLQIVRYLLESKLGLSILDNKIYDRLHLAPEVKEHIFAFKGRKELQEKLEKNLELKVVKHKRTKI